MPRAAEARAPSSFGFERVDGTRLVVATTRMRDMVDAARDASACPTIDEIECERRMHLDVRMQAARRLPSAEAHAAHAVGLERNRDAVDCDGPSIRRHAFDLDLKSFERRIDIARRTARSRVLTHHVPWLE